MSNVVADRRSTADRPATVGSILQDLSSAAAPEQVAATGGKAAPDRATDAKPRRNFTAELLKFENEVRQIQNEQELHCHLCNSARRMVPYAQCFYLAVSKSGRCSLKAASSISVIDRHAPFSRWIEKITQRVINASQNQDRSQVQFSLPEHCDATDEERDTYPYTEFLWTPQRVAGQVVGGALMARKRPWTEAELPLVKRVSDLYLHTRASIYGQRALTARRLSLRPIAMTLTVLAVLLGFLPVSITALAPVEVVPRQPFVLAAPFDGVVKEIRAAQGKPVQQGDTIIVFDNVHLLNEKKLADQRAAIAAARFQRASQGAIADASEKREIEVARAEYELARAESRYASDLLDKAGVKSPVAGIAIFSDKTDWEGRPVSAGEAIVSVADPEKIELAIDLPVKESIVLQEGARIKVYLDSDPLNPLEAKLVEASYRAQPDRRDILSYSLKAQLADTSAALPRIGVQGTAQVYSEKASLAYVIFRRPYAAFRQYTGW